MGLLTAGIIVSAIDLTSCRVRTPSSCDAQSSAISAAVGAAAGWIGGLLVPTKP
ncbi:putative signal peptide protein [Synechococcus phage S-LBS1]|nr:putative signal peptide protein [Synechococcus phage S-LBS1]